jgi:hypothetical protein
MLTLRPKRPDNSFFQFGLEQRGKDPKTDYHVEQEQPRDNQAELFGQLNAFVFLFRSSAMTILSIRVYLLNG